MESKEEELIRLFNNYREKHNIDLIESIKLLSKLVEELSKESIGTITIASSN